MYVTASFLALALPLLAAAAPTQVRREAEPDSCPAPPPAVTTAPAAPTPFVVIAARSGSPIHLQTVEASGEAFWIGKPASSFCPVPTVPQADCPVGTTTGFLVDDGGCSLDTEVPGGQLVFVGPNGALGFTIAHSAEQPAGALDATFTNIPGASFGDFGFEGAGATGFLACPNINGTFPYQIFADITALTDADVPSGNVNDCLGFDALSEPTSGPTAWEYT